MSVNSYELTNGYPNIVGLVKKSDKYDQATSLKYVFAYVIGVVSNFTVSVQSFQNNPQVREKIKKNCYDILDGKHMCVDPSLLIEAGLNDSAYVDNIKALARKMLTCKPSEFEKLLRSPLFQAVYYITDTQRWRGWEKTNSSVSKDALNTAFICAARDRDYKNYFDIFSMLNDTLKGRGNSIDALKISDRYVEYLKNLPSFRECYQPITPTFGKEKI